MLDAYGTGVFGVGVDQSDEGAALLAQLAELNAKELDEGLTDDEERTRDALRATLPSRSAMLAKSR